MIVCIWDELLFTIAIDEKSSIPIRSVTSAKRNCIPASDQSNAGGMQKDLVMLYKWPMKMQFFFMSDSLNNYLLHWGIIHKICGLFLGLTV